MDDNSDARDLPAAHRRLDRVLRRCPLMPVSARSKLLAAVDAETAVALAAVLEVMEAESARAGRSGFMRGLIAGQQCG